MAWMPWQKKNDAYSIVITCIVIVCIVIKRIPIRSQVIVLFCGLSFLPYAAQVAHARPSLQQQALAQEAQEKRAVKLNAVHTADTIRVDHFVLKNFKPFPELDWTQKRVKAFLADALVAHNHYFTIVELDQIARQLSIQMKQVGLMFSRVALYEQEIQENRVELTFEDGLLGEVVVMDAQRTEPELLVRPFLPHLQHTAVRHTLDQALYQLDQLPGIDVFGFFSFTDTPGLSRLNLRVVDESTWSAVVHTDNYGSEAVGQERVHATLDILNITGWGDRLTLNVGRSYSQPGFFEGYAQYTVPIGAAYQPLQFLISNSEFNLGQGFESLEVYGQSTLARVLYRHNTRFGQGGMTYGIGASLTESKVDSHVYQDLFFRDASVAALNFSTQYLSVLSGMLSDRLSQNIRFGFEFGKAEETSIIEDIGVAHEVVTNFMLFDAQYRLEYFHQNANKNQTSVASLRIFGSPDPLPSVEQVGFGGRNGIKGLPTGYFSADHGLMLNMVHDSVYWPIDWPGQLHIAFDAAMGTRLAVNDAVISSAQQKAQFASIGLGYVWEKNRFRVTYEFGKVIHTHFDNDTLDQAALDALSDYRPIRHYFSLSYDLGEYK